MDPTASPDCSVIDDDLVDSLCELDIGTCSAIDDSRTANSQESGPLRDVVRYKRLAFFDNASDVSDTVPLDDHNTDAEILTKALRLRMEYMYRIGNSFPSTASNFIDGYYPANLPGTSGTSGMRSESLDETPFHPPKSLEDHWGLINPIPIPEKIYSLWRKDGVVLVGETEGEILPEIAARLVNREEFLKDLTTLMAAMTDGPLRLEILQKRFDLHVMVNDEREQAEQKAVAHKDFYNVFKVDTHIHGAAAMTQKHLLRFIKRKLKVERDTIVLEQKGVPKTLQMIFDGIGEDGISAQDLSIDVLNMHADKSTFHRFDNFNAKYSPMGQTVLRDIFIKTDNYINGRFFAECLKERHPLLWPLTKCIQEVFSDLEDSKYVNAEPRLSIYGRSKKEWDLLAHWAIDHDVWSPNVRWIIQVPRLFSIFKKTGSIANIDQFLDNLFTPLFEVTNDPSSHPHLARFLSQVSGFDSVDDESKHEFAQNPPYNYYLFYMYANLCSLNAFRRLRGLNTFSLRPHCGEAGHISHLIGGFLTSESIAHGLLLKKAPVMEYLYYLSQIGVAMSPISNNNLFRLYERNPAHEFFKTGLNISLSTDDPLQFHFTRESLMEEYSLASQMWLLSSTDMCELARNSVLQSGFEDSVKRCWLGRDFKQEGIKGNDVKRSNVPKIRLSYRHEALVEELTLLFFKSKQNSKKQAASRN